MSNATIGEIKMFAGNFAPRNWAFCNGQILPIAQNAALFSILGTTYGGDGRTTFGLPDLQGRVPMHWGNGAGLTPRNLGEKDGAENVTLQSAQMPAHNHGVIASGGAATSSSPTGNVMAATDGVNVYAAPAAADASLAANAVTSVGGNQPHANVQPYLAVSFIICLNGVFPSRN